MKRVGLIDVSSWRQYAATWRRLCNKRKAPCHRKMPGVRCPSCGETNREGSLFCVRCGQRLPMVDPPGRPSGPGPGLPGPSAPSSGPPAPSASASGAAAAVCPSCGAPNPAAMNFCKMCGAKLQGPSPSKQNLPSALAAVSGQPSSTSLPRPATRPPLVCPQCGGQTPAGYTFCQHCGARLAGASVPPPAPASAPGPTPTPTPASGDASGPHEFGIADTLAVSPTKAKPKQRISPLADTIKDPEQNAFGRLVVILRSGTDGESFALAGEVIDIGRGDANINFADDACLARRHARVERRGEKTFVSPLDTVNGLYARLRAGEKHRVLDGDLLLVGRELLRFEVLDPAERDQAPAVERGVRLFGSPLRAPWGRLLQIVPSGVARDVYHLTQPEVILGREEGDIRFLSDEFMSRRHARLANHNGQFELTDEGSSNGTFVRIRGERELHHGDAIRVGDQVLRYEGIDSRPAS
ncbi:MAG TPA: zinc ribbon domain-containing protein [Haliangiales bacterium]|nr:zinc ribbon domain-containing protein [Haliangiales bacterium]